MGVCERLAGWSNRPVGRPTIAGVVLLACLASGWLFSDALTNCWIRGDDWEYVASSRTFDRTIANLLTPHNVHVVPVWRLVTWGVVASAGRLVDVRPALGRAAFAVLVATMLLVGRFVTKETGRPLIGLAAMIVIGSTGLMYPAGTWYSASQALAAGVGVLVMLHYLQGYRRSGGIWRLAMAVLATCAAGGCWTAGYVAGPVGTAYLLADGRRRCLRAAAIPFLAAIVAAATILASRGRAIEDQSAISFHGRKVEQALKVHLAPFYVVQSVSERLLFGELGLVTETTFEQAAVIFLGILATWIATRRSLPSPLEAAGAMLTIGSYLIPMAFRTYLPFSSLRGQVPWYDAIPQVGAVLFVAGWWAGLLPQVPARALSPLRRSGVAGLIALQLALLSLQVPRVNALFFEDVQFLLRGMTPEERKTLPIPSLQRLWAVYIASEYLNRQDHLLARLDQAEKIARANGIGRSTLIKLYGRNIWPEPPTIDDANVLALPLSGSLTDPSVVRQLIGPPFVIEPEARPPWMTGPGSWPPPRK
jgi:hypothetical protein